MSLKTSSCLFPYKKMVLFCARQSPGNTSHQAEGCAPCICYSCDLHRHPVNVTEAPKPWIRMDQPARCQKERRAAASQTRIPGSVLHDPVNKGPGDIAHAGLTCFLEKPCFFKTRNNYCVLRTITCPLHPSFGFILTTTP